MKLKVCLMISVAAMVVGCGHSGGGSRYEEQTGDDYVHDRSELIHQTPIGSDASDEGTGTYHTDPRYKYEYRTGTSGNYQYNYDVNGSDAEGNSVEGNVDMQGKYGIGTVTDADGNEKSVDVEWTG